MITPKYTTAGIIKLWDGSKKHMKITNKGDQSGMKERLEGIMGLMHVTDGGQRSQGQSDFHHPVYWCWAEMSRGIKPAGGKNKINAAVETLYITFPVYRKASSSSSSMHVCVPICILSYIYIAYMIALLQLILFLKSSIAELEGSPPPFYSPHPRSLVTAVVRAIISFAAFGDALLHFNSLPVYFANPLYL